MQTLLINGNEIAAEIVERALEEAGYAFSKKPVKPNFSMISNYFELEIFFNKTSGFTLKLFCDDRAVLAEKTIDALTTIPYLIESLLRAKNGEITSFTIPLDDNIRLYFIGGFETKRDHWKVVVTASDDNMIGVVDGVEYDDLGWLPVADIINFAEQLGL